MYLGHPGFFEISQVDEVMATPTIPDLSVWGRAVDVSFLD